MSQNEQRRFRLLAKKAAPGPDIVHVASKRREDLQKILEKEKAVADEAMSKFRNEALLSSISESLARFSKSLTESQDLEHAIQRGYWEDAVGMIRDRKALGQSFECCRQCRMIFPLLCYAIRKDAPAYVLEEIIKQGADVNSYTNGHSYYKNALRLVICGPGINYEHLFALLKHGATTGVIVPYTGKSLAKTLREIEDRDYCDKKDGEDFLHVRDLVWALEALQMAMWPKKTRKKAKVWLPTDIWKRLRGYFYSSQ